MHSDAGRHLQAAREKLGLTDLEVAKAVGLSLPTYYDLEKYDDLFQTISLDELSRVCRFLMISPQKLFGCISDQTQRTLENATFHGLSIELKRYLDTQKLSVEQFDRNVGWKTQEFLLNPFQAWQWNVEGLRSVCRELKIDWQSLLSQAIERQNL